MCEDCTQKISELALQLMLAAVDLAAVATKAEKGAVNEEKLKLMKSVHFVRRGNEVNWFPKVAVVQRGADLASLAAMKFLQEQGELKHVVAMVDEVDNETGEKVTLWRNDAGENS